MGDIQVAFLINESVLDRGAKNSADDKRTDDNQCTSSSQGNSMTLALLKILTSLTTQHDQIIVERVRWAVAIFNPNKQKSIIRKLSKDFIPLTKLNFEKFQKLIDELGTVVGSDYDNKPTTSEKGSGSGYCKVEVLSTCLMELIHCLSWDIPDLSSPVKPRKTSRTAMNNKPLGGCDQQNLVIILDNCPRNRGDLLKFLGEGDEMCVTGTDVRQLVTPRSLYSKFHHQHSVKLHWIDLQQTNPTTTTTDDSHNNSNNRLVYEMMGEALSQIGGLLLPIDTILQQGCSFRKLECLLYTGQAPGSGHRGNTVPVVGLVHELIHHSRVNNKKQNIYRKTATVLDEDGELRCMIELVPMFQTPSMTSSDHLIQSLTIKSVIEKYEIKFHWYHETHVYSCVNDTESTEQGPLLGKPGWFKQTMLDLSTTNTIMIFEIVSESRGCCLGVLEPLTLISATLRFINPQHQLSVQTLITFNNTEDTEKSINHLIDKCLCSVTKKSSHIRKKLNKQRKSRLDISQLSVWASAISTSNCRTERGDDESVTEEEETDGDKEMMTKLRGVYQSERNIPGLLDPTDEHTVPVTSNISSTNSIRQEKLSKTSEERAKLNVTDRTKKIIAISRRRSSVQLQSGADKTPAVDSTETGLRQSLNSARRSIVSIPVIEFSSEEEMKMYLNERFNILIAIADTGGLISAVAHIIKVITHYFNNSHTHVIAPLSPSQAQGTTHPPSLDPRTPPLPPAQGPTPLLPSSQASSNDQICEFIVNNLMLSNMKLREGLESNERRGEGAIVRERQAQVVIRMEYLSLLSDDGCPDGNNINTDTAVTIVEEIVVNLRTISFTVAPSFLSAFLNNDLLYSYCERIPYHLVSVYEGLLQPIPSVLRQYSSYQSSTDEEDEVTTPSPASSLFDCDTVKSSTGSTTMNDNNNRRSFIRHASLAGSDNLRQINIPINKSNKHITAKKLKKMKENSTHQSAVGNKKDSAVMKISKHLFDDVIKSEGGGGKLYRSNSISVMEGAFPSPEQRKTSFPKKSKVVSETPRRRQVENVIWNSQHRKRLKSQVAFDVTVIGESPDKIPPDLASKNEEVSTQSVTNRNRSLSRRNSFYSSAKAKSRNCKKFETIILSQPPTNTSFQSPTRQSSKIQKINFLSEIMSSPTYTSVRSTPVKLGVPDSPSINTRSLVKITPRKIPFSSKTHSKNQSLSKTPPTILSSQLKTPSHINKTPQSRQSVSVKLSFSNCKQRTRSNTDQLSGPLYDPTPSQANKKLFQSPAPTPVDRYNFRTTPNRVHSHNEPGTSSVLEHSIRNTPSSVKINLSKLLKTPNKLSPDDNKSVEISPVKAMGPPNLTPPSPLSSKTLRHNINKPLTDKKLSTNLQGNSKKYHLSPDGLNKSQTTSPFDMWRRSKRKRVSPTLPSKRMSLDVSESVPFPRDRCMSELLPGERVDSSLPRSLFSSSVRDYTTTSHSGGGGGEDYVSPLNDDVFVNHTPITEDPKPHPPTTQSLMFLIQSPIITNKLNSKSKQPRPFHSSGNE